MLIIVKSGPDTFEGKRGVELARDAAANLVLLQNGVCFAQRGRLEGLRGTVYLLGEDKRLRGLKDEELEEGIKKLDVNTLIELLTNEDRVVGMF
ncbi:MAG: hypothetical protein FJ242_07055 [Nitrospira sp.]|nr:hypothetical protein [Nitrospira sp.]